MTPVHAPAPMHSPAGPAAPGGIAGMLKQIAMRHAAARGPAGPGAHQAGAPYSLTQRGNPVSPYGHNPATPPVPNVPPKPMQMGGM